MIVNYKPLRNTLKEKGLNVTNVCRELGMSPNTRTKLSKDSDYVSLSTAARLCEYLDIPIEKVVEVIRTDRASESSQRS